MPVGFERRRVLIAADPPTADPLLDLFHQGQVAGWEAVAAHTFEQARFVLQHEPCDVLLVAQDVWRRQAPEDRAWLTSQHGLPVVLLARPEAGEAARERDDALPWVPPELAREHPALLAAALRQVIQITDLRHDLQHVGSALQQRRRQVDRLVGLLWNTLPADAETHWLTQRHVLERLQEEVGRAERYGHALTVILGEAAPPAGPEAAALLAGWLADRVGGAKRGCDIAGQYGPRGFLLVLAHTDEAGAIACCRRLQKILGQPSRTAPDFAGAVRVYFGIAGHGPTAATATRLLTLAEQRLEAARAAGEALVAAI